MSLSTKPKTLQPVRIKVAKIFQNFSPSQRQKSNYDNSNNTINDSHPLLYDTTTNYFVEEDFDPLSPPSTSSSSLSTSSFPTISINDIDSSSNVNCSELTTNNYEGHYHDESNNYEVNYEVPGETSNSHYHNYHNHHNNRENKKSKIKRCHYQYNHYMNGGENDVGDNDLVELTVFNERFPLDCLSSPHSKIVWGENKKEEITHWRFWLIVSIVTLKLIILLGMHLCIYLFACDMIFNSLP